MKAIKSVSTLLFALSISMYANMASADNMNQQSEHGSVVPDAASVRKIVIKPDTKWVNVTNGESITFVMDDKRFTYNFQTWPNTNILPLAAIAPAEMNVGNIRVYVAHPSSQ